MQDSERLKKLRLQAAELPLLPGVYIMKNFKKEIIYIGKAKQLKNRVGQYFARAARHTEKVQKMVDNVSEFNFIVVASEFEALVLESSLIKQHKPKYNILLKDDKGYSYIKVTNNEAFPRLTTTHVKNENDGALYLGPYMSSYTVKEAVETANKVFRLSACTVKLPQERGKARPCLNYHIGQCSAPCACRISKENYNEAVDSAIEFLRGGDTKTLLSLTEKMNTAAENLEFEKAARYRDTINALKKVTERQKVVSAKAENADIFALVQLDGVACFQVFSVRNHRLCDREEYILDAVEDSELAAFRSEFLQSYYSGNKDIPKAILIDSIPEDKEIFEEYFSQKAGRKVEIKVPQRGEGADFIKMAADNALIKLKNSAERKSKIQRVLSDLGELLGMDKPPKIIEAYDISHISSDNMVAAMVVFIDGKADKSKQRLFKIKSLEIQNDPAAMAETVERSLSHRLSGDEKFGLMPDLILLDGGVTQLNAVNEVLKKLGVNIPTFGMVKDDKHRTRAIRADGGEISITAARSVFTLIGNIQEEVHRVAIGYHRKLRGKKSIHMTLTELDGIGEKRAKALMNYFKTVTALKNASKEEIMSAKGMTEKAAQTVFDALHSEN